MIRFTPDFLENFLAVVRKYMQLRGGMTQKDLSDKMNVGISTMSRFFNLKTSNVDEQLVANITATLDIPLREIIDGIDVESEETFKRLVKFYKDQGSTDQTPEPEPETTRTSGTINIGGKKQKMHFGETFEQSTKTDITFKDKLGNLTQDQKIFLQEYVDLESSDRDLIVNLSNAFFKYLKQRKIQF